jgi:hypothetical protein
MDDTQGERMRLALCDAALASILNYATLAAK